MLLICPRSACPKDALTAIPTSPQFLLEHNYSAWEALTQKSPVEPLLVSTLTNHIPATSVPFFKHPRSVHLYTWILANAHVCPSIWHQLKKIILTLVKDTKTLLLAFWSIRNLSNLTFIFSFCRGVGCIFVEMIQGVAAFPGMKDIQDQLERIFLVSSLLLK